MALREILASFGVEVDAKALKEADAGIEGLLGKLKNFAGAAGVGAAVVAGWGFVKGLSEQAEAISKQARLLGMGTTELQTWQGAASIAGSSAEALSSAFKMMNRSIAGGTGPAVAELQKLGVSVKDASGKMKSEGQIFEDASTAIASIQDPLKRNAAGMKIFGRGFNEIEPLVRRGGAGIRALRAEVEELGVAFDEDFIQQSEELQAQTKKLDIGWQGLKVMAGTVLLPVVIQLVGGMLKLVKPIKDVLAHTEILQTATLMLGVKGFLMLSRCIGPLGAGLRGLLTNVLPLVAAFLLIEDFIVFMKGGHSAIGAALDSLFGKGTAEKARKFIFDVKNDFVNFMRELRESPQRVADDFLLFFALVKRQAKAAFGDIGGGIIGAFIDNFLFQLDLLTGGWDNATNKLGALFDSFVLLVKHGAEEIGLEVMGVAASIVDAFGNAWNTVLSDAQGAIGQVQGLIDSVPGMKGVVASLGDASNRLGGAKVGSARDAVATQQGRENMRFAEGRVAYTPALSPTAGAALPPVLAPQTENHFHIPPGTPLEQQRAIARAAQSGADRGNRNLRSAYAATVQGKG